MKLSLIVEATLDQVERRIPIWVKKYFDGDQQLAHELIPDIIQADPTRGKYSEWLIRQWKDGTARFPEDSEKLHKNLSLFHKKKSKLPEKDINKYTPPELAKALDENLGLTKSQRKKARGGSLELPPGAEYLGKVRNIEVVKITTPEAATTLSSGTQWCTAQKKYAKEYLEKGPLFLLYGDGERKYLFHYGTSQFMDVYDKEIEFEESLSLIDLISNLTGYNVKDIPITAFRYAADIIGGRWPEAEPTIAQDPEAAFLYARDVIGGRWPKGEPAIARDGTHATLYAQRIIQGRWPEGEPAIIKEPAYAVAYAKDIIGGRWPEAEPTIAKDALGAYRYARNIIGGRWPEAEPTIAKDPLEAQMYADDILGRRWPEVEPTIAKNPIAAEKYAEDFIGGRWPEAEPAIAKIHWTAARYAKNVIGGRFPQGESAIATDARDAYEYARDVIEGRWPKGEPTIAKDAKFACLYAKDVIGGRFPKGESAIAKDPEAAAAYKRLLQGAD